VRKHRQKTGVSVFTHYDIIISLPAVIRRITALIKNHHFSGDFLFFSGRLMRGLFSGMAGGRRIF
jgi:hypothetical protein